MNPIEITLALLQLSLGATSTINGHLVTRWANDRFTVGRINPAPCSTEEAVSVILT